jgi:hypothetical protein
VNLERLRWGEWIALISALDLLLVTFRAWYKVTGDGRVTAWDALEQGRYLLIATAVAGIFLWLARAAEDQTSFPIGWLTAGVGLACTVYVAYRLATPPADNLDADVGLYFGLAGAFGVTVGGLLSAREPEPAFSQSSAEFEPAESHDPFAPATTGAAASGGTWSPAAPVASTAGWSPASPAAPAAAATAAGAVGAVDRPLRSGDSVVLTAGGARFAAGTVAEVVEVFAGGALVEVRAPDGMAERFEVPESAYEHAAGGGAAAAPAGDGWSPAMPAAASDDWGFDEPAATGALDGAAVDDAEAAPKPAKVPWWKREIGGGKKKRAEEAAALGSVAAGAAALEADRNGGAGDEKPGFFKRLFGGGSKAEPDTETLEAETTPASDVAGVGQAAESDTSVDEPIAQAATDEAPSAAEPEAAPEPSASEPEVVVTPDPEPEPEPIAAAPEPEPEPAASEPEVVVTPDPEPEPIAPEPEPAAPEPEVVVTPEPEREPIAPEPPASQPEPAAAAPDPEPEPPATPEPDTAPAASSDGAEEERTSTRRRSSGSRKVPKEALAAAVGDAPPKVGDAVALKVGGGRFDAGTKGTVVDVFSAGVIVELSDDQGRTERLDLPFEAIRPADT